MITVNAVRNMKSKMNSYRDVGYRLDTKVVKKILNGKK